MMGIFLIVCIIILVLSITLIFWFVKKLLTAIVFAVLVIIILLCIAGFSVYSDVKNLKENFAESKNLFLLKNNNEIIAGFSYIAEKEEISFADSDKLDLINNYYEKKQYEKILDNNYKMLVFNMSAFDFIKEINLDSISYSREQAYELLESDKPADFKGSLFGMLVKKAEEKKGHLFMFEQYKKGNILHILKQLHLR